MKGTKGVVSSVRRSLAMMTHLARLMTHLARFKNVAEL
jgi:hypothetical protein